jgi:protein involved in polysaccharide export with SLBB domain
VSDAIKFAQGFSCPEERIDSIIIARLDLKSEIEFMHRVETNMNFPLTRGDKIIVYSSENQNTEFSVYITGEVNKPGRIFISKDGATLREVINKAGGFTESAWISRIEIVRGFLSDIKFDSDNIFFERKMNMINRYKDYEKLLTTRMSNIVVYDTAYFYLENELRFYNELGSVNLDLNKNIDSEQYKYKIENGDVIVIPKFENKITVFGQVPHTGRYEFVEGKDIHFYINKAGGFGELSLPDEIMLIKGGSRNWLTVSEYENLVIEPGDMIWIPKDRILDFGWYLYRIGAVAGIIGSVATLILLLTSIK